MLNLHVKIIFPKILSNFWDVLPWHTCLAPNNIDPRCPLPNAFLSETEHQNKYKYLTTKYLPCGMKLALLLPCCRIISNLLSGTSLKTVNTPSSISAEWQWVWPVASWLWFIYNTNAILTSFSQTWIVCIGCITTRLSQTALSSCPWFRHPLGLPWPPIFRR